MNRSGPASSLGVRVLLPAVLADLAAGSRTLMLTTAPATVGELLDEISTIHPALVRRIRDETGAVRRFVNIYVDGDDIRHERGLQTALTPSSEVQVLPSVAGG